MWTTKLPRVPRVHGLHVAAGGRVLVVGGPTATSVCVVAWVGPGTAPDRRTCGGQCYAVTPDLSRLIVGRAGAPYRLDLRRLSGDDDPLPDWSPAAGYSSLLALSVSPDGRTLASLENVAAARGFDNRLTLRAADSGAVLRSASTGRAYGGLAWHPAGDRLAVFAGREFGGGLVEFGTELAAGTAHQLPSPTVKAAAYGPDGRLAAVCGRTAYLLAGGRAERFGAGGPALTAAAFAPDGRLLTAAADGTVRGWDADSGRELFALDPGIGPLHAVGVAADGLTAAVAGRNAVAGFDL